MSTRREFLKHTAAGALVATSMHGAVAGATTSPPSLAGSSKGQAIIKSVARREETVLRLGGNGDNWHMSWAADDRQYVSLCDGYGWSERPPGLYNTRLLTLSGGPYDAKVEDVTTYPDLMPFHGKGSLPRYYGFGTLALDGRLYQFLSTLTVPFAAALMPNELRFIGAKLIYSPDNGRTWHNQDGSTPVVWENWNRRSRDTLVFYKEDQEAFSLLTVLQMGRNYEHNRDGYIYVYAPNGNTDGTMNELVMFRVPKTQLLNRSAYEYFCGLRTNGEGTWTKDIALRNPIHVFPRGWVSSLLHPYGWQPSVTYNAPLGLYMMANWGTGCAANGEWFTKPSYLGLWVAPQPWGPWTQIFEELAWTPGNDPNARAYQPQISPKWIAKDGKSFWLVWTDFQSDGSEAMKRLDEELLRGADSEVYTENGASRAAAVLRKHQPYYAFNAQRVDLIIV